MSPAQSRPTWLWDSPYVASRLFRPRKRANCLRRIREYTGHEPGSHIQHLRLRDYREAETPIEADVLALVGFEIREAGALIHPRAEISHQRVPDPLTLSSGLNRNRTQVPVRLRWIPSRPRADPLKDARGGADLIGQHHRRKNAQLFCERCLAVSGRGEGAYPNQLRVAKAAHNFSTPIHAMQHRNKKTLQRAAAAGRFAAEGAHVDRVVAHRTAQQQRGQGQLAVLQAANCDRVHNTSDHTLVLLTIQMYLNRGGFIVCGYRNSSLPT